MYRCLFISRIQPALQLKPNTTVSAQSVGVMILHWDYVDVASCLLLPGALRSLCSKTCDRVRLQAPDGET